MNAVICLLIYVLVFLCKSMKISWGNSRSKLVVKNGEAGNARVVYGY